MNPIEQILDELMNWQDIKVSRDGTHFIYNNKPVFSQDFIEVIKFHAPGLAPVKDDTGLELTT